MERVKTIEEMLEEVNELKDLITEGYDKSVDNNISESQSNTDDIFTTLDAIVEKMNEAVKLLLKLKEDILKK